MKRRKNLEITAAERRQCHIGLLLAIDAAGTKAALGRKIGVSKQAVDHWEIVPAEKLVAVERATETKVLRHQLRPDIFRGYVRAEEAPARTRT